MGSSRKSKSVNKRFSNYPESLSDKDVGNSNKSRQRKRKLSDMLGSQWSKDELERFYEAYRKYGKDWKKVAGMIRNRSVEMVEALYNMNRAYLSLPEGTASVAGLIAMMTDHYNVLEGSDSDQESNDISRKPQKRGVGKVRLSSSKDLLQSQSNPSIDGCLSLLKRRRSDGCAVGKRTPRFPVSHAFRKDDSENYFSPNKRGRKSEVDNDVEHAAALALTEASQRGGSPHTSQSPYRREPMKPSPLRIRESMIGRPKLQSNKMDGDMMEGSLGSRATETSDYARDVNALMDIEGVGTVEVYQKGKKVNRKKEKLEDVRISPFDDGFEACSGTGGRDAGDVRANFDDEVTGSRADPSSSQGKRKRNKKLFFGDESSALDALQTLADLSLMMPGSTAESESALRFREDKPIFDSADRSSVLEAVSTSCRRDKTKLVGTRKKILHAILGVDPSTCRKSKHGKDSTVDSATLPERKEQPESIRKSWKRKRKSSSLKISKLEAHSDSHKIESSDAVAVADEEEKIMNKRIGQNFVPLKTWKSSRSVECSSSNSDQKRTDTDSVVSTTQILASNEVVLPAKHRSRRKMDPKRTWTQMDFPDILSRDRSNKLPSLQDSDKLGCCLSSFMLRRWCTFEWFYSAIDYPWFAKREFVEYLNHVGLGHIPRLTRVEWGVIRSSLGKPRRFSARFLCEEREKLRQYRESVRKHYTELRAGIREGLPTDLARPLSVGQRVIALHPKSREVHDGSVLTVDHDKCRIQFDRPELGVEFVLDIDCMPLNPLDNMPEALRRQFAFDKFALYYGEPRAGQSNIGGSIAFSPSEHLENVQCSINALVKQGKGDTVSAFSAAEGADVVNGLHAPYSQPCTVAHIHARDADIRALSELTRSLDKKEAILMELKHANDDLLKNQNEGANSLKNFEPFKKQYAMILLQLKEASDQVSSALLNLRQRNTYPSNSLPTWLKSPAVATSFSGPARSLDNSLSDHQELGSNVVEIINDSRVKAHKMVDVAIRAMSSVKEEEDAFARLGEALDSLNKKTNPDSGIIRSPEQVNGGMAHQNQLTSSTQHLLMGHTAAPTLHHGSERTEVEMPSELITSCVATLLMIQMCTERQYPPADVAQILDCAVTGLHPSCPQNLPVYREIQLCMGRIKTQLLALVPT